MVREGDMKSGSESGSRPSALWVVSAVGIAAFFVSLAIQQIWNADIWWQLRTGQWILEHRAFPRFDEFSFTVRDHAWIELRWMFCVLAYWGWEAGGAGLLIIAQAAVIASAWWIIVSSQPRASVSLAGMAIIALGVAAGSSRFLVRPEIITYLMLSVFLVTLQAASRRGQAARVFMWLLPVLQVVWVNSHTLFVFGPIVTWVFAIGAFLQGASSRLIGWPQAEEGRCGDMPWISLTAVAALTTLACVVNPYGIDGAMFPLILIQEIHKSSVLGSSIEEFRSPFQMEQMSWSLPLAAALIVGVGATFVLNWRRLNLAAAAIFVAMVYLAAVATRNMGLLAFAGVWAGLVNVQDVIAHRANCKSTENPARFGRPLISLGHVALGVGLLIAAWQVAANRLQVRTGMQVFGLGLVEWTRPVEAVEFMMAEPDLQPNVFHDMADASWLIWRAGERFPVFVDGRLEVYGEDFLNAHLNMDDARIDQVIADNDINVALVSTERMGRLATRLMNSPDWALVHLDANNLVFVRDIPQHDAVIAKWRIDPQEPWAPRRAEPDEKPAAWQRLIGSRIHPWFELGMMRSFLTIGSIDNAETYARRGMVRAPENAEFRLTLAQILRSRGRNAEADGLVAGMELSKPTQVWAQCLLAELLQGEGRMAEAIAPLEEALRLEPNDGAVADALARLQFGQGDFERAKGLYRRLAKARPGDATYWVRLGICQEQTGEKQAAVEAYRRALQVDPTLHSVHNQLGTLLAQERDVQGAMAAFEAALRIKPDYEAARKNLEFLKSAMEIESDEK